MLNAGDVDTVMVICADTLLKLSGPVTKELGDQSMQEVRMIKTSINGDPQFVPRDDSSHT